MQLFAVSQGGLTGTVADPKLIMAAAVKVASCSIFPVHNHSSSSLKPSQQDEELNQKNQGRCQLF